MSIQRIKIISRKSSNQDAVPFKTSEGNLFLPCKLISHHFSITPVVSNVSITPLLVDQMSLLLLHGIITNSPSLMDFVINIRTLYTIFLEFNMEDQEEGMQDKRGGKEGELDSVNL